MVLTRTHLLCDKESKTLVRERKHNMYNMYIDKTLLLCWLTYFCVMPHPLV